MFSHNKSILFNELIIEETCEEICTLINDVSLESFYKSHLLDFFRTMVYYKNKQISFNQGKILAKLQDSKKEFIYYRTYLPDDQNS